MCRCGSNYCINGTAAIFIDAVSLLAVSAGAACFALAAKKVNVWFGLDEAGCLQDGWPFCRACAYSKQFPPAELSLLGKQLAVLFLGPLYGFGLFSIAI